MSANSRGTPGRAGNPCRASDSPLRILEQIALKIENLIREHEIRGISITLKIKYADFQVITRSITDTAPLTEASVMMAHVRKLLESTEVGKRKVRLLGITISNFVDETGAKHRQLLLPFSSV
jgi:DNA polymerase-4